jgi:hypothetical protein
MFMDKFKDRETFVRYVYELHKAVNDTLGKPTRSFSQIVRQYERARVDSPNPPVYATVNVTTCRQPRTDTIRF